MNTAEKIESTELTLPERAAVALGSTETARTLYDLVETAKKITSITNKAGREECHAALMLIVKARTAITKTGKAARDDANAFCKSVIAEEKRLIDIVTPEELRLQALRDTWDAEIERQKEELSKAEQERVDGIRLRIAGIRSTRDLSFNASAETIVNAIRELKAVAIDESFAEFRDEAKQAKSEVLGELVLAQNAAIKREREAAEKAEADRIERERIAAERAENERVQAELKRQQEELRAEQEKAAAELKRQQDEAAAALKKQQEELAAQQAALRAEREEAERQQREERERLDAERAEMDRRRAEIEAAQNPAPIEAPEDGETFPVVGAFEIIEEQEAQPLGDAFPPYLEDAVHPVITDIAEEIQRQKLSPQARESFDLHRAWCVSCIARAPSVSDDDVRSMVHGMCQTMRDEIEAIDSIFESHA